jgi:hypothetical protein
LQRRAESLLDSLPLLFEGQTSAIDDSKQHKQRSEPRRYNDQPGSISCACLLLEKRSGVFVDLRYCDDLAGLIALERQEYLVERYG